MNSVMSVSGVGAPYSSKDDDRQHQFSQPMKLKGRTEAPDERRGRTLSSRARGAKPLTSHGPLQRLLDRSISHSNSSNAEPSGDAAMDMRGLPASDSHRM